MKPAVFTASPDMNSIEAAPASMPDPMAKKYIGDTYAVPADVITQEGWTIGRFEAAKWLQSASDAKIADLIRMHQYIKEEMINPEECADISKGVRFPIFKEIAEFVARYNSELKWDMLGASAGKIRLSYSCLPDDVLRWVSTNRPNLFSSLVKNGEIPPATDFEIDLMPAGQKKQFGSNFCKKS